MLLGLAAAVHPCPLAGNAAALALVCGWGGTFGAHLRRALALVAGQVLMQSLLILLVTHSLEGLAGPRYLLPTVLRPFLGPLLVLAGMVMTGLLPLPRQRWVPAGTHTLLQRPGLGLAGSLLVGLLLGLAFCPATAALFFLVLLPLASQSGHPTWCALAYATAFGLPLLVLATGIAAGVRLRPSWSQYLPPLAGTALIILGAGMILRWW